MNTDKTNLSLQTPKVTEKVALLYIMCRTFTVMNVQIKFEFKNKSVAYEK